MPRTARQKTTTEPIAEVLTPNPADARAAAVPADRIAARAYERFLARGCEHGYDQEDWLAAEEECRRELDQHQRQAAATEPADTAAGEPAATRGSFAGAFSRPAPVDAPRQMGRH